MGQTGSKVRPDETGTVLVEVRLPLTLTDIYWTLLAVPQGHYQNLTFTYPDLPLLTVIEAC